MHNEVPRRVLGRTREDISIIGLGGSHIGKPVLSDDTSIRMIRSALDAGINFLDNSWDYNSGTSDLRIGRALRDGYRQKAFLMTKVDGRTKKEAMRQLDVSLQRMRVDSLDLLQHHEVIRYEDADRIFAEGGAMEAFIEARQAGKIRYIGFTGHKDPHIHLHMLDLAERHGFSFDAVQMPLNVMDAHYRSFERVVLPRLVEKGIGVIGMKSLGGGIILESRRVTASECLRYVMSLPITSLVAGIDSEQILHQALEIATAYQPLTKDEITELLQKTADAAQTGHFELFKTSSHFDQTAKHPKWLGEEPSFAKDLVHA